MAPTPGSPPDAPLSRLHELLLAQRGPSRSLGYQLVRAWGRDGSCFIAACAPDEGLTYSSVSAAHLAPDPPPPPTHLAADAQNLGGWEGLEGEGPGIASLSAQHFNQVGCPFSSRCPIANTNALEREVVAALAGWLHLPRVGGVDGEADGGGSSGGSSGAAAGGGGGASRAWSLDDGWGYLLPGSSLGNLQGWFFGTGGG
jgi:hypothetical protein